MQHRIAPRPDLHLSFAQFCTSEAGNLCDTFWDTFFYPFGDFFGTLYLNTCLEHFLGHLFMTLFWDTFWTRFLGHYFETLIGILFWDTFYDLSVSYLISLKHLLFENIAHDKSFRHCTWLHIAVPGCTWLHPAVPGSALDCHRLYEGLNASVYTGLNAQRYSISNSGWMGLGKTHSLQYYNCKVDRNPVQFDSLPFDAIARTTSR